MAAVAALVLATAAPVTAAAAAGVRTTVNGVPGPHLALAQLRGNVDVAHSTPTTTRRANGSETSDPHGGTSAKLLVVLAGLDPGHVLGMAIERPNTVGPADPVELSPAEIQHGFSGDPDGPREATFDADYGDAVRFFRPLRTSSPGDDPDVNALDALDAPTGSDLVVHLVTDGGVLTVTASPLAAQATAGTPVHFSAAVDPPRAGVTFAWDFGDGETSSGGATADHAYAQDGRYQTIVTALTPDGDSGAAAPVAVQVGSLGGGRELAPAAGAPVLSAGSGGSGRGGAAARAGGGSGSRDAPSQGTARGGVTQVDGRRGVHTGVRDGGSHAAHRVSPSTAATRSASTADHERAHAAATHAHAPQRSRAAHATAGGRPAASAASSGAAARVSGVLLAARGETIAAAGIAAQSDPRTRRDAAARASAASSQPLSWWLLASLGLAALVGLGAARESGVRLTGRLRGAA